MRAIWLHVLRSRSIARRYMVVNGFDGALTMLGLLSGFHISHAEDVGMALTACLGAALALFISGISSAYLSERAERLSELRDLEKALLIGLEDSDYGQASRLLPVIVALANGLAPLLLSLVILLPLFFVEGFAFLPFSPFLNAIAVGLLCVFTLGVFIGRINGAFWLWSGIRTLLTAVVTVAAILFMGQWTE